MEIEKRFLAQLQPSDLCITIQQLYETDVVR